MCFFAQLHTILSGKRKGQILLECVKKEPIDERKEVSMTRQGDLSEDSAVFPCCLHRGQVSPVASRKHQQDCHRH